MALTDKGIRVIEETITSAFEVSQEKWAANEIWLLGISSAQLQEFRKTIRGQRMDESWYQGTLNALRDIERTGDKRR